MPAARRNHGEGRHDVLGDAPVVLVVLGIAARPDIKAAVAFDHLEHRLHVAHVVFVALGAAEQRVGGHVGAMQPRHVTGIDAALHRLQPIALLQALRHEALAGGYQRELPLRQRRRSLRRPHIGPQHAALLDEGVGFQLDAFGKAAFRRLRRHFDALPGDVELPAMIRAAQAAFLVASEPQRGAAMRAEFVDQAVTAFAVSKRNQPLGKHFHPHRRAVVLRQFLRQQNRGPIAAEHLPHRRRRPGLGDEIVLVFSEHRFLRVKISIGLSKLQEAQLLCGSHSLSEIKLGVRFFPYCGEWFDLDQIREPSVGRSFYEPSTGERFMPIESAIVAIVVTVVFVGFALVLSWAERQTRDLHHE
jgi:hypothetical protein